MTRTTGVITDRDRLAESWISLAPGAVIITPARLGNHFRVRLTENATLEAPHSPHSGQRIAWRLEQPAAGGVTVTPNPASFTTVGATYTISTAASAVSFLEALYDDVAGKWEIIGQDADTDTTDHTALSNIGTNTHAQIDTAITNSVDHIADTANPHGTEVADDATPTLGGDLDVDGNKVKAASGGELVFQLGDAAGAKKLSVTTSGGSEVFKVMSDGQMTAVKVYTTTGQAMTQTYATASATHAARTATGLTDNTSGTATTELVQIGNTADVNYGGELNANFASLLDELALMRADYNNTAQVLNKVIDEIQAGLLPK